MKFPLIFSLSIATAISVQAQQSDINPKIQAYINKYKDLAIQEQWRTGVPAAIKLAQGIHETAYGTSELCNNAKNHFGIKCKSTWTGDTYAYDDDARNECFRKYKHDYDSYIDHSDFLRQNKRYANLFTLDIEDYKGWAKGLKAAGYATHPQYANLIINTIEKYQLQEYTLLAKNSKSLGNTHLANNSDFKVERKIDTENHTQIVASKTDINAAYSASNPTSKYSYNSNKATPTIKNQEKQDAKAAVAFYELTTKNGLKGFYVQKGDHLLAYADKFKVRYSKLIKNNELKDAPVSHDMFIYLDKKLDKGLANTYTVGENETLSFVSQETGVSIEKLKFYNNLVDGVEPQTGSVLNLQSVSNTTPEVYIPNKLRQNEAPKPRYQDAYLNNSSNFIATNNKPKEEIKEPIADISKTAPESNLSATTNKEPEPKKAASYTQYESKIGKSTASSNDGSTPKVSNIEKEELKQVSPTTSTENMTPYEKLKMHMANNASKQPEVDYNYDYIPAAKNNTSVTTTPTPVNKTTTSPNKNTNVGSNAKFYTVKKGDTLYSIAKNNNVTVDELQKWNNVTPKTLTVGKKLKVSK